MKKNPLFLFIAAILAGLSAQAQTLYVPNATNGVGTSSNGNVGVGTNIPRAKFEVKSSGTIGRLFDPTKAYFNITDGRSNLIMDPNEIYGSGELILGFSQASFFEVTSMKDGSHFSLMRIKGNGNVGIGTTNPDAPLTVAGNIHAREVKVTATAGGADFVFADDYALPKLEEVEAFVKQNKHLPEIPSAADMEANGLHLAEMNIKLLQKVEELTLYTIEQEKNLEAQQSLLDAQAAALAKKEKQLEALLERVEKLEMHFTHK
jgi:hypothetical protein